MNDPNLPTLPRKLTAFGAVYWMVFAWLTMLLGVQLVMAMRPEQQPDLVTLGAVDAVAYLFAAALLLGPHGPRGPHPLPGEPALAGGGPDGAGRGPDGAGGSGDAAASGPSPLARALGMRSTHWALLPLGFFLGVVLQVPAGNLESVMEHFWPLPEEVELQRAALFHASTPVQAALMVIVIGCVVPLAEEVFFRGALFGALRRSGRTLLQTVLITSLGFGLSHGDLRMLPAILLVAAVLGGLRAASGSLLPGLALHVAFNSTTMVSAVTGWLPDDGSAELPTWGLAVGWATLGALLLAVWAVAAKGSRAVAARGEDADGQ